MYKIGIDARLYGQTGIGIYLQNLLHFLEGIPDKDILYYVYFLKEDFAEVRFKDRRFVKRLSSYRWHSFSEQLNFAWLLYRDNLDMMHFTYFSYPVLYRKKFIATVHDTTPLYFKTGKASTKNPLFYELKHAVFEFVISEQIKNAQAIITPTKTVKKQLVEIYGKQYEDKIKPIYEGVDYQLIKVAKRHSGATDRSEGAVESFYDKKPFFVYVGNFYPHKNVELLIEAFAKVKEDVQLVLVGPDDFFAKRLLQFINKLKQSGRIVFYHNPLREEMVFFYKNAKALIHPSLSEGFGLPLVEALNFDLPIIASDIPVFKELLEDTYISFDPNNTRDMLKKIELFLKQKPQINYVSILKKLSFRRMAEKTYSLYKKTIDI